MARDDFPPDVKRKLRDRIANSCSNPECKIITSGPSEDSSKSVNNIGKAAHICAASPGGPRYNPHMSPTERKSIENGIWLCANCADMIDRDVHRYPIELLYEWKDEAEKHAHEMLGKKPPDERDTINTLKSALSGESTEYISTAIDNVHKATIQSLEKLDSRFKVATEHINGYTRILVTAKNNSTDLFINVKDEYIEEYKEKHQKLIEHGETLIIDSRAISIEDSELLKKLVSDSEEPFCISKVKQNARIKLWIINPETKQIFQFDDILGDIKSGTKSFSFDGTVCNEMLKLQMQMSFELESTKVQMPLSLEAWNGVDLQYLPYFEKMYNLFVRCWEGWEMFISLEVNGLPVLESAQINIQNAEIRSDTFKYINSCKVIAKSLQKRIVFKSNFEFSIEELEQLIYLADLIEAEKNRKGITTTLVIDSKYKNINDLIKIKKPILLHLPTSEETIKLFGEIVYFPKGSIVLSAGLAHIYQNIDTLKSGDVIDVEWIPEKDSYISFDFD